MFYTSTRLRSTIQARRGYLRQHATAGACPTGPFRSGLARAESYNPIQALSLAYNNQGGLELKFTLQSVNGEQLSDAHNPRPREGLLAGSAKGPFEHTCAATSAWPSL